MKAEDIPHFVAGDVLRVVMECEVTPSATVYFPTPINLKSEMVTDVSVMWRPLRVGDEVSASRLNDAPDGTMIRRDGRLFVRAGGVWRGTKSGYMIKGPDPDLCFTVVFLP